jgi:uncharacterized protein (TIGR02757 family)
MAKRPAMALSDARARQLRQALDALVDTTADPDRMRSDPLQYVRRYETQADQEVAGVIASGLAFGRVAAFLPVIGAVLDLADAAGGPAQWAHALSPEDRVALGRLQHRWVRGTDLCIVVAAIAAVQAKEGSLGAVLEAAFKPDHDDVGPALDALICQLQAAAVADAGVATPGDLPHGAKNMLPRPADGSACKRWNLLLRWMVRAPGAGAAGVDLGRWRLPADRLVIPLDVHVGRIAGLLGLTGRTDGSWTTAAEITRSLRRLHPSDPLRYDFAIAHLGISGACEARPVPDICGPCRLRPVCSEGARLPPTG